MGWGGCNCSRSDTSEAEMVYSIPYFLCISLLFGLGSDKTIVEKAAF